MTNKLDFSNPEELQTRDGRAVRIYATDGSGSFSIQGAIACEDGWRLSSWRIDGLFGDDNLRRPSDLVAKTQRVTGWLNVYKCGENYVTSGVHESLERASAAATSTRSYVGMIFIDTEIQT